MPNWSTCSTGRRCSVKKWTVKPANLRNAAHRVADAIYEKIIGVRGAFATRIAYVSVDGKPPNQHYQLIVADADGENPRMILQSDRPLMSPAWSADGEWLAYVSFETARLVGVRAARCSTGKRSMVSARAGINGAPTWSPDGKKLALTLSGSNGNLDIYLLDLAIAAADAAHRRSGHRHRGGVLARRQRHLLHLGSLRQSAGLPDGARRRRAAAARHLHRHVQCASARFARRQAARGADARRRRLSHRPAGPGQRHAARCCRRAARTNRRASRPTAPW